MSTCNKFFQPLNGIPITSTGAPISIPLGFTPYEVYVYNDTAAAALTTTATTPFESYWNIGMEQGSARLLASGGTAAAGSAQPVLASYTATGGIMISSTSQITYGGQYTGTAFTAANPAAITGIVPTGSASALVTGQTGILWLSKATGASQWQGAFYNFTATSSTSVTLTGVNNSTFTAGTSVSFTLINYFGQQLSSTSQVITAITSLSQLSTQLTLANNVSGIKVGSYVSPKIPTFYGTVAEALNYSNAKLVNNMAGYLVTAVSGNNITIEAPTQGTTFSYPTDASVQASLGKTVQKPQVSPNGISAIIYDQPQTWTGTDVLTLGTNVVGLSGDKLWVSASQIVVA